MGQDQPESWPPPGQAWTGQPAAQSPLPTPAPPTAVPGPRDEWGRPPMSPAAPPQQWIPPRQQWTAGPQQTVPAPWPQQPPVPIGPPPEPPQPRGAWSRSMVLAVAFAVVVLLVGGGVGWWLWQRPAHHAPVGAEASSGPAGRVGPSSASAGGSGVAGGAAPRTATAGPTTPPSPPPDPQAQALAQLDQLRQQSRARLVLDGRWVAQVASKSVGITDPLQTAANGTHTFYATDILAESVAARNLVDDPSKVYVLWGTDFGKRSQAPDGKPYWITIADAGFASSAAVQQWCRTSFPTLDPQQLADTCAPRQLTPPHD